jgi:hypothetical protein
MEERCPFKTTKRLFCLGNQCCGSGMFIPDPDFYSSWIPDPKTVTKWRVKKRKLVVIPFLVTTKFTKFKNILFLKC